MAGEWGTADVGSTHQGSTLKKSWKYPTTKMKYRWTTTRIIQAGLTEIYNAAKCAPAFNTSNTCQHSLGGKELYQFVSFGIRHLVHVCIDELQEMETAYRTRSAMLRGSTATLQYPNSTSSFDNILSYNICLQQKHKVTTGNMVLNVLRQNRIDTRNRILKPFPLGPKRF